MEGPYPRYNYRFAAIFYIISLTTILSGSLCAQKSDSLALVKAEKFLFQEYPRLLEIAKDYLSLNISENGLAEALRQEIKNTATSIHPNTIIEYAKIIDGLDTIMIKDFFNHFLVNYAGSSPSQAVIQKQCIMVDEDLIELFYTSINVVSDTKESRKMIFKKVGDDVELRRISYAINDSNCNEDTLAPNVLLASSSENENSTKDPTKPKAVKMTIPEIRVIKSLISDGYGILYGQILHYENDGILIDTSTGDKISVSSRDGFFVIQTPLRTDQSQNVHLKYIYGDKFIESKKLIIVKS